MASIFQGLTILDIISLTLKFFISFLFYLFFFKKSQFYKVDSDQEKKIVKISSLDIFF